MKKWAIGVAASLAAVSLQAGTAKCTFSNPAYSGSCVEAADVPEGSTPGAVCGTILACLNDTMCTRTYCQATTIRSGWKLDKAEDAETPGE
jgi:hypothetical protein